jgi:membrane protease YdiL (CAAX protease family)
MLGWAVVLLVVTTIVGGILESGVASAFGWEGQEVDPRYRNRFADVPGNTTAYLYWLSVAWIIGGFTEEMLFRGVLISRFERIFGNTRFAMPAAVILQAIVFGQQHFYYQGWAGAVATGATALVSGVFYIALKRNLWPLIISHGLANTLGLTLIYAGLQPAN